MKNKCIIVLLLFCLISIGLYAQSTPVDQKLVGTWVDLSGQTWVFNSDGTGTSGRTTFKYTAFSNKTVIYYGSNSYGSAYDYIFSPNGNTVMLLPMNGSSYALTKKD